MPDSFEHESTLDRGFVHHEVVRVVVGEDCLAGLDTSVVQDRDIEPCLEVSLVIDQDRAKEAERGF
jgi:hypothetical protein